MATTRLTERQQKVEAGIAMLTKFMVTYDKQSGYLDYTDDTIINDILYGLGVAINEEEYSFASGFDKFKEVLRQHLNK